MYTNKSWFTLVELIVVITILAILGTIWFLSLQWYTLTARDSSRISDTTTIAKTLDLYKVTESRFPNPSDSIDITFSGSLVWEQGVYWDETRQLSKRISEVPLDPLSGTPYSYSLLNNGQEYELWFLSESQIALNTWFQSVFADNNYFVNKKWNFNWVLSTVRQGEVLYILWTPTLLTTALVDTTYNDILSNDKFSIINSSNLPSSYADNLPNNISYTGSTNLSYWDTKTWEWIMFVWTESDLSSSALQEDIWNDLIEFYAWSILANRSWYKEFINLWSDNVRSYVNNIIAWWVGWLNSEYVSTLNPWSDTISDPISEYWTWSFVSTWDTWADSFLVLPFDLNNGDSIDIEFENLTDGGTWSLLWQTSDFVTVNLPSAWNYRVIVTWSVHGLYFNNTASRYPEKIISVEQWGDLWIYTMNRAFNGAVNLVSVPNNTTGLEWVWNMSNFFQWTTNFNGDISLWDTSNVTRMANMFYYAPIFNGDISLWDVSNVTNLDGMFRWATSFNRDISWWDLSSASSLNYIFHTASSYNQDLSWLDVSTISSCTSYASNTTSWVLPKPNLSGC